MAEHNMYQDLSLQSRGTVAIVVHNHTSGRTYPASKHYNDASSVIIDGDDAGCNCFVDAVAIKRETDGHYTCEVLLKDLFLPINGQLRLRFYVEPELPAMGELQGRLAEKGVEADSPEWIRAHLELAEGRYPSILS